MTFALEGGGGSGKADESTDNLREWDSHKGEEGVKRNPNILRTS